mgnify:CR=1 FL=1
MKLQLIIPMSGIGQRFKNAGYSIPKFLIKVKEKEIINHVVNMFEEIENIIFICNENHLQDLNLNLKEILYSLHPKIQIVSIAQHKKGPIHAVLEAENYFNLSCPTIVNYCDFNSIFSNSRFLSFLNFDNPDGCVFTYTGFHPHMLKNTNYAYVKKRGNSVIDIQEKKPFTEDPTSEEVSSGTYFFKSAELMIKYFKKTVSLDLNVKGEYYVSMAYKPMIDDGLKINTFLIDYFMQWGTPSDLEEFNWYKSIFDKLSKSKKNSRRKNKGCLLMPMAGNGSRFIKKGYKIPKPFIKVSGEEMYLKAIKDLPKMETIKIVTREDIIEKRNKKLNIRDTSFKVNTKILKNVTEGQACTCLKAMEDNDINLERELIISACDMGIIYDLDKYKKSLSSKDVDILVWGCKGFPGAIRRPNMYSWIYNEGKYISNISVKNNLNNPKEDNVLIGTFTFKKAKFFLESAKISVSDGKKINGEYYVDDVINYSIKLGLKVALFQVEYFVCWGTPEELETFKYWESCFEKWKDFSSNNKTIN